MFIKRKMVEDMRRRIRCQCDNIEVMRRERESLLDELIREQEARDRADEAAREAEKKLQAAEARNEMMTRAVKGMKELRDRAVSEAAELRGENRTLNSILDSVAAKNNGLLIEAAFSAVE